MPEDEGKLVCPRCGERTEIVDGEEQCPYCGWPEDEDDETEAA